MENSPFNRLPAELRVHIYRFALYRPEKITVAKGRKCPGGKPLRAIKEAEGPSAYATRVSPPRAYHEKLLVLTTTCRQIRNESMPVFMQVNSFVLFRQAGAAATWLKKMKRWTPCLKNVEMAIGGVNMLEGDNDAPVRAVTKLVKRMVRTKTLCSKFGISTRLTVLFECLQYAAISHPWIDGIVFTFEEAGKAKMLEELGLSWSETDQEVLLWQNKSGRSVESAIQNILVAMLVDGMYASINLLVCALFDDPEWSRT